jgi:CRP-like cAMP-binding protein
MTTRPDLSLDALELSGIGTRFQDEIREHLDELELTRDLERKEQDCLAGLLRVYAVPAGHELFAEGDPAGYLALLLEGRMSVSKRRDDSGSCALYTLNPGKVFGEMALLDQEPRSASVTALTDCQIAVLTRDHFQRLCEGRSVLAVKLLLGLGRTLSQRLRRASGQLVDYL